MDYDAPGVTPEGLFKQDERVRMKPEDEALAEVTKAAAEHRKRAKALKAEGLSNLAIARVMGISGALGLTAEQKVDKLLKTERR